MRDETFWHIFNKQFKPGLEGRGETFEQMFLYLDRFDRPVGILETGCVRDGQNWTKTGGSTILFDTYAKYHSGSVVYTIDLDPEATSACRNLVGSNVKIHTGDSVAYLRNFADAPPADFPFLDLLYLDSYDVDLREPGPSALHHLKEIAAITPLIRVETLVALDDSPLEIYGFGEGDKFTVSATPRIGGKGKYIAEYAEQVGATQHFSAYQCGWTGFRSVKA